MMSNTHSMKRYLPSLSALSAFEAAAIHLNFTRAGEDIGLTQSGISRQVAALEAQLGLRLFERIGPKLVLSDAGRAYRERVSQTLDQLEEATIDLVRGSARSEMLQIGVQDSLGSQWLVSKMTRFIKRFPDQHFTMLPVDGTLDFSSSQIDVAVLRGRGVWPDMYHHHLMDEKVVVVAAPSLIPAGTELPPTEFCRFPLIQNAHRPASWLRWLEANSLSHNERISGPRFSQTNMVIQAAIAGIGLAVVPRVMVEVQLDCGLLHMPLGGAVPSGFGYYLVYPFNRNITKPITDFRDWLVSETRSLRM